MNAKTLLLRQAHPKFMAGDEITTQVFMPFPKDKGGLSVYDGDKISASDSHEHYTKNLGCESHSVWAVSKEEAEEEQTMVVSDPQPNSPSHALINFEAQTNNQLRKAAKKLKIKALKRGLLFKPV